MEWIANNWLGIFIAIVFVTDLIIMAKKFSDKPTEEKISKFKEWLLLIVAEAEKELGSGTGQLKLRYVYDKALAQFPVLTMAISFEKFSEYVDEALEKFKNMLQSNEKVQEYVGTTEA